MVKLLIAFAIIIGAFSCSRLANTEQADADSKKMTKRDTLTIPPAPAIT